MEIKKHKGGLSLIIPKDILINMYDLNEYLSLVPDNYQQYRHQRDGDNYHLTIIPSKEKSNKDYMKFNDFIGKLEYPLLNLGLGKTVNDAYYLVCHFPY